MRSTFEETVLHETSVFRTFDVFGFFGTVLESDFGRFRRDFNGSVIIVARNPDGKCCQGVN